MFSCVILRERVWHVFESTESGAGLRWFKYKVHHHCITLNELLNFPEP